MIPLHSAPIAPAPSAAADSSRQATPGAARPQIAYLVYREGLSAVFASQVVTPVQKLAASGYPIRLAVFSTIGEFLRSRPRRQWQSLRDMTDRRLAAPMTRLPSPPNRARWAWDDASLLAWWLRRSYGRAPQLILHCRGRQMASLALNLRRRFESLRVVYDCRGVEHAELELEGASPETVDSAFQLQADAARRCDHLLCVSRPMADYMAATHGVPRAKLSVAPCCVDLAAFLSQALQRDRVRAELSLADRFVVGYCGSLRRWQCPDECLGAYRAVKRLVPSAHFLALTTEPDKMRRLVHAQGVPPAEVSVLSVPHEQVPRYLAACDLGLLMREASLVNRVASPVKVGEYLASGTPLIACAGIGDYSDLIARERLGAVLAAPRIDEEAVRRIEAFLQSYRAAPGLVRGRCRAVAQRELGSDRQLAVLASVYSMLAAELGTSPSTANKEFPYTGD